MDKEARRKYIKLILKLVFTAVALYFVLKEIDIRQAGKLIRQIHPGWLCAAFLFFNLSKIVSAFRLNKYFQAIPVYLNNRLNLKLYYLGMFYNLFLPGSIGGDGYKIYLINKRYKTSVKDLIKASLLDRISGVVALAFLAGVLFFFAHKPVFFPYFDWVLAGGVASIFPAFYIFKRLLFRKFIRTFWVTNFYSFGVQLLQVICAIFLLLGLSVEANYKDYLVLFLVSSVVSVLPVTVGGVGARELVFILGDTYLPIDKTVAVSFSLLFFGITAVSSLIGAVFPGEMKEVEIKENKMVPVNAAKQDIN